jgi:hypothetical protein
VWPVFILLAVFAALVVAAGYALFGNPHTDKGKKRKQEVVNGFRLTGGFLLGFVLMGTLVVGAGVAFFGLQASRLSSKPLAFDLALLSLACIALMVQRWAKYFPGWIGYGVLNGLLVASSGHLVNNPAIPVRRSLALAMTGLCFVSALVCLRFTEAYRLNKNYGAANQTATGPGGKTVAVDFSLQGGGGLTTQTSKDTITVNFNSDFLNLSQKNEVGITVLVGHEGQHVVDGAPKGRDRLVSEIRAESASQDIAEGMGLATFTVRGIELWNSQKMNNGSEGTLLRENQAVLVGVKDYEEDVDNDPK